MTSTTEKSTSEELAGQRVALVGKLAGMSKREAQHGPQPRGTVIDRPDASATCSWWARRSCRWPAGLNARIPFDEAVERGTIEVITETQLWQRLGLVDRSTTSTGSTRRPCWPICWACRWR